MYRSLVQISVFQEGDQAVAVSDYTDPQLKGVCLDIRMGSANLCLHMESRDAIMALAKAIVDACVESAEPVIAKAEPPF